MELCFQNQILGMVSPHLIKLLTLIAHANLVLCINVQLILDHLDSDNQNSKSRGYHTMTNEGLKAARFDFPDLLFNFDLISFLREPANLISLMYA